MRHTSRLLVVILAFSPCFANAAATNAPGTVIPPPEDRITVTTLNGITYTNCLIRRVEPDGISIMSRKGITKVLFVDLPEEVRAEFGYNSTNAAAYATAMQARRAAGAVAAVHEQHAAALRAAEIQRTQSETDFIKAVKKLALKVRGTVGGISNEGLHLESAQIEVAYVAEVNRPGYRPMNGNRVFEVKTEKVDATADYQDVFVIGAGRNFYDGQKWTGIVYPAGLYTGNGSTVKCYSFSAEEAARRMIRTNYTPPPAVEAD